MPTHTANPNTQHGHIYTPHHNTPSYTHTRKIYTSTCTHTHTPAYSSHLLSCVCVDGLFVYSLGCLSNSTYACLVGCLCVVCTYVYIHILIWLVARVYTHPNTHTHTRVQHVHTHTHTHTHMHALPRPYTSVWFVHLCVCPFAILYTVFVGCLCIRSDVFLVICLVVVFPVYLFV